MKKKKILMIGLDGGTMAVVKPLAEQGLLPNLASLMKGGVSGDLESTMPFITPPAWATFFTAKHPGRHGLFDFTKTNPDTGEKEFVNFSDVHSDTLWSVLTKNGKKVCSINVPLTYPMPKIDGYLISGLMSPPEQLITHPESLAEEITTRCGYIADIIFIRDWHKDEDKIPDLLTRCTEKRTDSSIYLMKKFDWDFFMTVYTETDRMQHILWDHILDERRPEALRKKVLAYYTFLDASIGRLIKEVDSDTTIMVMSDHGFGPIGKKVYLNKWLRDKGFLAVQEGKTKTMNLKRKMKGKAYRLLTKSDKLSKMLFGNRRAPRSVAGYKKVFECMDWDKTLAFAASNTDHGITINLKGRNPYGVVEPGREYEELRDRIIRELRGFKDPDTGEVLVTEVHKREEVYSGPFVEKAPDILFVLGDGRHIVSTQHADRLVETSERDTGSHRINGMFIASGPEIARNKEVDNARIIDVMPTILYDMGLAIPDDIDGRIMTEIFDEGFLKEHSPRFTKPDFVDKEAEDALTSEEKGEMEERLKSLGYMD
jgi:predicted AlkP superfamily phosphohydrolase/phosphomutase